MDKQLNELLLSIAKNIEHLTTDPALSYLSNGYLLLIAQDIYEYLDMVDED